MAAVSLVVLSLLVGVLLRCSGGLPGAVGAGNAGRGTGAGRDNPEDGNGSDDRRGGRRHQFRLDGPLAALMVSLGIPLSLLTAPVWLLVIA